MTAVTVMAAAKINKRKVRRRLLRAGYEVEPRDDGFTVSKRGRWDAVTMTVRPIAEVPADRVDAAHRLLGFRPRAGVTCSFEGPVDGPVDGADAWPTVVDVARALAAVVPLAVLDDHAGTTYLVNAARGLVPPAEYEQVRGRPTTSDFLRRLLGG